VISPRFPICEIRAIRAVEGGAARRGGRREPQLEQLGRYRRRGATGAGTEGGTKQRAAIEIVI